MAAQGISSARLWGKIKATEYDYYILEGVKEGGWGNERDLGYVLLNAGGDTGFFRVSVSVCYQLPCGGDKWSNPGTNVVVDIYKWYP